MSFGSGSMQVCPVPGQCARRHEVREAKRLAQPLLPELQALARRCGEVHQPVEIGERDRCGRQAQRHARQRRSERAIHHLGEALGDILIGNARITRQLAQQSRHLDCPLRQHRGLRSMCSAGNGSPLPARSLGRSGAAWCRDGTVMSLARIGSLRMRAKLAPIAATGLDRHQSGDTAMTTSCSILRAACSVSAAEPPASMAVHVVVSPDDAIPAVAGRHRVWHRMHH